MAKDLPRYKSTEAVRPAATPRLSGEEEIQRQLDKASSNFSSNLNSVLNFEAREKGKEEGQQLDFDPKTPITKYGSIEERAAEQANQVQIAINVRDKAREEFNREIDPRNFSTNSPENYQKTMDAYLSGIIKSVPETNREYAKNVGSAAINRHKTWLLQRAQKLGNQEARATLTDYLKQSQNSIAARFISGDIQDTISGTAEYGDAVRKIDTAVLTHTITPEDGATLKNKWKENLQRQAYLGQFRQAAINGKGGEYLQKFLKNPPSDMDINVFDSLIGQMHSMGSLYQSASEINKQSLEQQTINAVNRIASGELDADDPAVSRIISNQYNVNGSDAGAKVSRKVDDAQYIGTSKGTTKFLSPTDFENAISILKRNLNPNSTDYNTKLNAIKKVENGYYKNRQDFEKDPYLYVLGNPYVKEVFSQNGISDKTPKGIGVLKDDYYQTISNNHAMYMAQKMLGAIDDKKDGIPRIRMISKQQAKEVVSQLKNVPPDLRVERLQQLADKFVNPKYRSIYFRNLKDAGLNTADLQLLNVSNNNPQYKPLLIDYMNTDMSGVWKHLRGINSNINTDISTSVEDNLSDFIESSNNDNSASLDMINGLTDNVKGFSAYLMQKQKLSASDAAEQAANVLINDNFNYETLDGAKIRIDKDYDKDTIIDMLKIKKKQVLGGAEFPLAQMYGLAAISTYYLNSLKANSHWVTKGDNTGYLLVDGSGSPVITKDKNGKPKKVEVYNTQSDQPLDPLTEKAMQAAYNRGQRKKDILSLASLPYRLAEESFGIGRLDDL